MGTHLWITARMLQRLRVAANMGRPVRMPLVEYGINASERLAARQTVRRLVRLC